MKKITKLLVLFVCASAFAQPVINSSDFDNLNMSYYRKSATSTTVNQGLAGANVTWNFSSLVLTSDIDDVDGTNMIQAASGPFSSSFPTSNYVLKFNSILNSNPNSEFYSYNNKTANKIEEIGGGSNTELEFSYINPSTVVTFPFSFGMSNTDTSQENVTSSIETQTQTYDAYGTLITPYATYTNVIRLKTETAGSNYVSYTWIKVNPYQDLASAETAPDGTFYFSFNVPPSLANKSFETSKMSIYPNPASSILNISLSTNSEISKITISDLSGKKIMEQNDNINALNMENLAKGLYVIEVLVGDEKLVKKFIKE